MQIRNTLLCLTFFGASFIPKHTKAFEWNPMRWDEHTQQLALFIETQLPYIFKHVFKLPEDNWLRRREATALITIIGIAGAAQEIRDGAAGCKNNSFTAKARCVAVLSGLTYNILKTVNLYRGKHDPI